jgi:hypothetical protein
MINYQWSVSIDNEQINDGENLVVKGINYGP